MKILHTEDWDCRDRSLSSSGIWSASEGTGFGGVVSDSDSLLFGLAGRFGAIESNWALTWLAICSCWSVSKTSSLRLGLVTVQCPTILASDCKVSFLVLSTLVFPHFDGLPRLIAICLITRQIRKTRGHVKNRLPRICLGWVRVRR